MIEAKISTGSTDEGKIRESENYHRKCILRNKVIVRKSIDKCILMKKSDTNTVYIETIFQKGVV